ncbi:MAG: putative sulfate exporter family transporter [Oligoflexia bacterium]|nr:putative sulfate exporter family transporter [Oligoflexia bacterium]
MKYLPGWALLVVGGLLSQAASSLVVVGGKQPLEASVVAIVLGICVRNLLGLHDSLRKGVATSDKLLVLGVVLLGAGLDFSRFLEHGLSLITVIMLSMACGFFIILIMGRACSLSPNLSLLLATGTTICGTSAIAITAPLIKAKDEETSYAVATVAFFGLLAIFLYPVLGRAFSAGDFQFGVFAGTAIHSTPQVVGAGYLYSELAGQTATTVKLLRNCFMAPLAMAIAYWHSRGQLKKSADVNVAPAFPWFLFGYILMAACASQGFFTAHGVQSFQECGKFLVLLGMVGVGLNTRLATFAQVGSKPLIVGLLASGVLAILSALFIALLLA